MVSLTVAKNRERFYFINGIFLGLLLLMCLSAFTHIIMMAWEISGANYPWEKQKINVLLNGRESDLLFSAI